MAKGYRCVRERARRGWKPVTFYSREELEEFGDDLNRKYDPERLTRPKPVNVYEVLEFWLHVNCDWKYITPDQSVLGLTVFNDGYLWVWPKPYYRTGMKPKKVFYDAGTIVIDSTLTESKFRGRENFTVMHEAFHYLLHRECPEISSLEYSVQSSYGREQMGVMTDYEIGEFQANRCAAAFLMPRTAIQRTLIPCLEGQQRLRMLSPNYWNIIRAMAKDFEVSQLAMRIRLSSLGLSDDALIDIRGE